MKEKGNKHLLVIVDMQNDFITGALANKSAEEIIPRINDVVKNGDFDHILYTRDTHFIDTYNESLEGNLIPEHCLINSWGWNLDERILYNDKPKSFMNKHTFGYTGIAEFIDSIDNFDEVTFVGTCTDICVLSNVAILRAARKNLKINVIKNCCAGLTPEKHDAAITAMSSLLVNII